MKRIEMALNNIDNLIGEIGKLIEQFKSYETIASETLEASNELIEILREDSKLGEKEGGSRYSGDNESEEKSSGNIFAESVNIFSSSVNTFQNAVNSFVNGVGKGQTAQAVQSSGSNIDYGKVLGGAALAGGGIFLLSKVLGLFGGGGGGGSGGGGGGFMSSILSGVQKVYGYFEGMEKVGRDLRTHFLYSFDHVQKVGTHFSDAAAKTKSEFGTSMEELAKIQKTLTQTIGRTSLLSTTDLHIISALDKMTGGKGAEFSASFDEIGISVSNTGKMWEKMASDAVKWGVDVSGHAEKVRKNIDFVHKFTFRDGVNGLSRMAAYASRMRMDMSQTESFAKKYQDFESAFDTSAKTQVLGGVFAQNSNPFQNMFDSMMDPEALQKRLVDMGKSLMRFDSKTGQVNFNSLEDRLRAQAYANETGLKFEEMTKAWTRSASEGHILAQLKGTGLNDKDKDTVAGKANFSQELKGWAVPVYDAKSNTYQEKLVNQLTPEDMKDIQAESEISLMKIAHNTHLMSEQLKNAKEGFFGGLRTLGAKFLPENTLKTFNTATNALGKAVGGLSGLAKGDIPGYIGDQLKEGWEGIKNVAEEGFGYLKETVFPVIQKWWKEAKIGETISEWWDKAWGGITSWWEQSKIWDSIQKWWKGDPEKEIIGVKDKILELGQSILDWFKNGLGPVIRGALHSAFPGLVSSNEEKKGEDLQALASGGNVEAKKLLSELHKKYNAIEGNKILREQSSNEDYQKYLGAQYMKLTKEEIEKINNSVKIPSPAQLTYGGSANVVSYGGRYSPSSKYDTDAKDAMILSSGNSIVKFDSQDDILAAKPGGALGSLLNNAGIASRSGIGSSGNLSHSGGINITLSGTIQLQDPNGHIHNWEGLTRNTQFISQITDKISLEITKKINHGNPDGQLLYGNYRSGMFG